MFGPIVSLTLFLATLLFCIFLNYKNKTFLSSLLFCFISPLAMFMNGFFVIGNMNIELLIVILISVPPLIICDKSEKYLKIIMLYVLSLAFIFKFFKLDSIGLHKMTPADQLFFNHSDFVLGAVWLTTTIFIYYKEGQKGFQTLENQKVILNESLKDKKQILSILFHDLSNSLNISLLRTSPRSIKNQSIETITCNVEKAHKSLNIINDIICHVRDLEKIKSGKATISLDPVNINEVYEDALFIFQDKLKEKGLTLNCSGDKSLNVLAKKVSLSNNIINNFISNAIKFSSNNSVITLDYKKISDELVQISISDKGVGIPQNLIENLFQFNKHTTRLGTNGEEGSGFGMPIAQAMIVELGGSLEVISSTSGETGTTFVIKLKGSN